jgi:predicted phosphoribosyltransferase/predicted alpha/beta-hydrolase family hydrolase
MIFRDRGSAGLALAERLTLYRTERPLVLALPRGGVPVAAPIAEKLGAPLDVLIVRKLGAPENREYAIGALAEGAEPWVREGIQAELGISPAELSAIVAEQRREVRRRQALYRNDRPPPDVRGRCVLVIDDGLATGATATAAVKALKHMGAARIVVAVPVAATSSAERLRGSADAVVTLFETEDFSSVGQWYEDFRQVEDAEVRATLAATHAVDDPAPHPVEIHVGNLKLPGLMLVPTHPIAWIVFAHGSGSSRLSPRNLAVAQGLYRNGCGILLFDLLKPEEAAQRDNVFDIALLANRLELATRWLYAHVQEQAPIAYFGASTGAAAALRAAADISGDPVLRPLVCAVVSRGGRPDLAADFLAAVAAPTLLIVGGADETVLKHNQQAAQSLRHVEIAVVPGASHLFEEPGAMDQVVQLTLDWVTRHAHHTQQAWAAQSIALG